MTNEAKTFNSLQQLIAANQTADPGIETIDVPGLGGCVYMRSMTGTDRDRCDSILMKIERGQQFPNFRANVVGMCLCDKEGRYLNPTAQEVIEIGRIPVSSLQLMFAAAQRLSAIGDGEIEDIAKN